MVLGLFLLIDIIRLFLFVIVEAVFILRHIIVKVGFSITGSLHINLNSLHSLLSLELGFPCLNKFDLKTHSFGQFESSSLFEELSYRELGKTLIKVVRIRQDFNLVSIGLLSRAEVGIAFGIDFVVGSKIIEQHKKPIFVCCSLLKMLLKGEELLCIFPMYVLRSLNLNGSVELLHNCFNRWRSLNTTRLLIAFPL